ADDAIGGCRNLCNALMAYQAEVADFGADKLAGMRFETRMVPAVAAAQANHVRVAFDGETPVAYAYSSVVAPVDCRLGDMPLVDPASVAGTDIGILNNFYLEPACRGQGVGTALFADAVDWLRAQPGVSDLCVFVSNGNVSARRSTNGAAYVSATR
ncbi:MAG: GNAT family N-acetyltransferase, partial [Rhodospirillaceae bacterium]